MSLFSCLPAVEPDGVRRIRWRHGGSGPASSLADPGKTPFGAFLHNRAVFFAAWEQAAFRRIFDHAAQGHQGTVLNSSCRPSCEAEGYSRSNAQALWACAQADRTPIYRAWRERLPLCCNSRQASSAINPQIQCHLVGVGTALCRKGLSP